MSVVITLPPTPKIGRTIQELNQAIAVWTKQAQNAVVTLAGVSNTFLTDAPSDGNTYGRNDSGWSVVPSAPVTGNLTEASSSVLSISGGSNAVIGSGTTIQVKLANGSQSGYLSSTDWLSFNAKLDAKKATKFLVLCSGTTPGGTGASVFEMPVPYATDGSSLTFNVTRLFFRVGTAGGAPAVTVEKYSGTGTFSATTVGTVTLGSGAHEASNTASLGTVTSGDKLRYNVGTLGTAQFWTVTVEIAPL